MSGTCSTHKEMGNLSERNHLGHVRVDGRLMLKNETVADRMSDWRGKSDRD
jgi:hypothetical protein